MATINVFLPESLQDFIDAQVATGTYGNISAYICMLVLQDQKRQAREQLQAILGEAIESDVAIDMGEDDWHLWP